MVACLFARLALLWSCAMWGPVPAQQELPQTTDPAALLEDAQAILKRASELPEDDQRQPKMMALLEDALERLVKAAAMAEARQNENDPTALLLDAYLAINRASTLSQSDAWQQEVDVLLERATRKILESGMRMYGRSGPTSYKKLDHPSELVPGVPASWPRNSMPVWAYFDNGNRRLCAIPHDTLVAVKCGTVDPEGAGGRTLALVCKGITVWMDFDPLRWTTIRSDLLEHVTRTQAEMPNQKVARHLVEYRKLLEDQSELSMRRMAASLAAHEPDYDHAPLEELCLRTTCAAILQAGGGMPKSIREIQAGAVTLLLGFDGDDVLGSSRVDYLLFVNGVLHTQMNVYRRPFTETRAEPEGWRDHLATIHRSILTCCLRLEDND